MHDLEKKKECIKNVKDVPTEVTNGGYAWKGITWEGYLEELVEWKGGDRSRISMGGAFSATDLNRRDYRCGTEGFNFNGSTFQKLIDRTTGTDDMVIPACSSREDFKRMFLLAFENLARLIEVPQLLIAEAGFPIRSSSLQVSYKGQLLPSGPVAHGGHWMFDPESSSILFLDMGFTEGDDDAKVLVEFEKDTGYGSP